MLLQFNILLDLMYESSYVTIYQKSLSETLILFIIDFEMEFNMYHKSFVRVFSVIISWCTKLVVEHVNLPF